MHSRSKLELEFTCMPKLKYLIHVDYFSLKLFIYLLSLAHNTSIEINGHYTCVTDFRALYNISD